MINQYAGINDWFIAAVDTINTALNTNVSMLFETDDIAYPSLALDYYQVGAWSDRRMQFYDAAHLHVKVTQNDNWLALAILTKLDSLMGNLKNSVYHRALVNEKALDELTKTQLLAGSVPVTLPDNVELVTKPGGWTEGGTENMKHYFRDLQFFYHN